MVVILNFGCNIELLQAWALHLIDTVVAGTQADDDNQAAMIQWLVANQPDWLIL